MAKKNIKSKIMNVAHDMLWQDGYKEASVNNMVAAAGVSKGAFFHYFPTKQSLTLKVMDTYVSEQVFRSLDQHMTQEYSAKNGVLAWLLEVFEAFEATGFRGGCMLGNFALEMSDHDEALRERLKTMFLDWENRLTNYLKREPENMLMQPRQLARLIIAGLQGTILTGKVHKDRNRASREFHALAEMIEHMMKG